MTFRKRVNGRSTRLDELPTGATVRVGIIAANGAGEAQPCPAAEAVVA